MPADLAFPVLEDPASGEWHWPMPPYAWRDAAARQEAAQPCRIESLRGTDVAGELLRFQPAAAALEFRSSGAGRGVVLPFSRMRRLVLTQPLRPSSRFAGAPAERVPAAAQERDYRLESDQHPPFAGRTAGYVEREEGLYLYTPVDEERSLLRTFVPRSAFDRCSFGPSAEELAAEQWCATPAQLLAAIERQQHAPLLKMGQALLALGLVTPAQLERALCAKPPDVPLGEMLVAQGLLSGSDLQTAIAHKMGYPLVDLTRFPVDPQAARRLPLRVALEYRTLPLMVHGRRLIVAVDRPSRTNRLRTVGSIAQLALVPVLASRSHIMTALQSLAQDIWADHVPRRPVFFATTT